MKHEDNELTKYNAYLFELKEPKDVVEYWQKLLYVSMNTFKFNVKSYLHEDKRMKQNHLNKILLNCELREIVDVWPIEKFGDNMGPGGKK